MSTLTYGGWVSDVGDTQAIHMGHLTHKPHGEREDNKESDNDVKLNAEEGGMPANLASSCEVISHLSWSVENLFPVWAITDHHDVSTSHYETH